MQNGKEAARKGIQLDIGDLFEPSQLDKRVNAMAFRRGLPTDKQMQHMEGIRSSLRLVALNRFVWRDSVSNLTTLHLLDKAYKNGWVHAQPDKIGRIVYHFPTGLH